MNPQNIKEHITMQHSTLWRKPLLYQKSVPKSSPCHTQMNELAATGVSWRMRNSSIPTRISIGLKPKRVNQKGLSEILRDQESLQETSQFLQTIKDDVHYIDKSEKLINGVRQLKKMRLLNGKTLQRTRYPGVSRYNYIHNDYHERVTNPGFSRNFLGRIYTR